MDEFHFSKQSAKEMVRFGLSVTISMLILLFLGLLVLKFSVMNALVSSVITGMVYCGIFIVISSIFLWKHKKQIILIVEPFIEFQDGDKSKRIPWKNIIRVRIMEDSKGEIDRIDLFVKNHKPIRIGYFVEPKRMFNLIQEYIPESTEVSIKRYKLNWKNPFIMFGAIIVGGLILSPFFFLFFKFLFTPFCMYLAELIYPYIKNTSP
jgi:hypothetical protein